MNINAILFLLTELFQFNLKPPPNECSAHETKVHLMVRLHPWSFEEYWVPHHFHYSQVHFEPGLVLPIRGPIYESDRIVQSFIILETIWLCAKRIVGTGLQYLKPFNSVQTTNKTIIQPRANKRTLARFK